MNGKQKTKALTVRSKHMYLPLAGRPFCNTSLEKTTNLKVNS